MIRIVVLGEKRRFRTLFGQALKEKKYEVIYKTALGKVRKVKPQLVIVVSGPRAQKQCLELGSNAPDFKTILWVPDWTPTNKTPKGAAHFLSGARDASGIQSIIHGALILTGDESRLDGNRSVSTPPYRPLFKKAFSPTENRPN